MKSKFYIRVGVRVGDVDLVKEIDCAWCEPSVDYGIEKALVHSKFSNVLNGYDIALLRLKTRVKFTTFVRPVCLPLENQYRIADSDAVNMTTMAFRKSTGDEASHILLKTHTSLVALEKCDKFYRKISRTESLHENLICAKSKEQGGLCKGIFLFKCSYHEKIKIFINPRYRA